MKLEVGQDAPPFDVVSYDGRRLRLADYAGRKHVVLFFYPRDFTRVCTAEACGFRDLFVSVGREDVEIIGVSSDSNERHARFAHEHAVPYPLVADESQALARTYGAVGGLPGLLGLTRRRTFVIDKSGKIAAIFEGELSSTPHLEGVRNVLDKLP